MSDYTGLDVTSALTQIKDNGRGHNPSFEDLSECVLQTHQYTQTAATRAINQFATLRNWLIGCYIVEYEQKGKDRARYGERLLKRLEERINSKVWMKRFSRFLVNFISNTHKSVSCSTKEKVRCHRTNLKKCDTIASIRNLSWKDNQSFVVLPYPGDNDGKRAIRPFLLWNRMYKRMLVGKGTSPTNSYQSIFSQWHKQESTTTLG